MIILGLNAYHGDSSACIVIDGRLVAAVEEERFRRIKHWAGFPAEAVIDIANHLISFFKWREPTGVRDLFQILKEHGIISKKDLPTFQNMASFRNMLVHRYETIDEELVFELFRKRLDDFEFFIRMVVNWGERQKE